MLSLLLTGVLAATVGLTGCGSSTSSKSTTGELDKDQHITVAMPVGDIKTLDASIGTDLYSSYVLQEVMAALARDEVKDGKDSFVPDGAKSWNVSSDGKTWTIHLRDTKWTDGAAVTADQYEYALKRTLAKTTASQYAYLLVGANIVGAGAYNSGKGTADGVGIKATDKLTLEIKLNSPCAYFEKLLSNKLFIPQRKDLIEKFGAKYGTTADSLVYNGPFKIASFKNADKVEMVKNDTYWDKDSVKLQKLTFLFMGDESSRMNAFMSGQTDRTGVNSKNWKDKFANTKKYTETEMKFPSTSYTFFNTKNKYFSNIKIRKAFSLAFDRKDYVNVVRQGIGKAAYSWAPPSLLVGNDEYRAKVPEQILNMKDDPKALLIAGLKEIGADPDPAKMSITYLELATDELAKADGDYFINAYKTKLGINLKVNYMEWAQGNDEINKGNYDMSSMGWSGDYNDAMTFFDMFETGAGIVVNFWSNKEYDSLIEDAKNTMDQSKRLADFTKAENILVDSQAVIAPTFYQEQPVFRDKFIKGIEEPLFAPASVEWKYAYTSGR